MSDQERAAELQCELGDIAIELVEEHGWSKRDVLNEIKARLS